MLINSENEKRISKVVHFIHDNPETDFDLGKLADLANYSPFHFQKLFKSFVGETPKQYILRIRIETAAHQLVMFPQKTVTDIALDYGFSSSATFARAFKNYFGLSAQDLRNSPDEIRHNFFNQRDKFTTHKSYFSDMQNVLKNLANPLKVSVKRTEKILGIFVNAALDNENEIKSAFKKVSQLAETNELLTENTKFLGMIVMHQNIYQTIATVEPHQNVEKELNLKEIAAGRFASIEVSGNLKNSFQVMNEFHTKWIPGSGYQISDIVGFEILSENPSIADYSQMKREIYIPISAVR